jgi:hypothetical protein
MANTYVALAKTVLTTTQATVTFSSIPSSYTDLIVLISARTDGSSASYGRDLKLTVNSSSSGYSYTILYGRPNSAGSFRSSSTTDLDIGWGTTPTPGQTANTFGSIEIYIPNYVGSTNKAISIIGLSESNNATDAAIGAVAGLWSNTSAITSITIDDYDSTNFVSGSRFDLYGIKNS